MSDGIKGIKESKAPKELKKLNNGQKLAITILRILSCIAVFSIHYSQRYGDLFPPIVNRAASFGQDGLWMFFILSGFLLCHSNRNREFCTVGGGGYEITT